MSKASLKAYQIIRGMILKGSVYEGDHLKEEELVKICEVSRTPVREALRRLESEKYVENKPNQGTFVTSWSLTEIDDIFEMRSRLEGLAAARAAELITDAQINRLEEAADKIDAMLDQQKLDVPVFLEQNALFHAGVIEATGSSSIARVLSGLVQPPIVARTALHYSPADLRQSNDHHREMILAFRAHDPLWAESVMNNHIRAARRKFAIGSKLAEEA